MTTLTRVIRTTDEWDFKRIVEYAEESCRQIAVTTALNAVSKAKKENEFMTRLQWIAQHNDYKFNIDTDFSKPNLEWGLFDSLMYYPILLAFCGVDEFSLDTEIRYTIYDYTLSNDVKTLIKQFLKKDEQSYVDGILSLDIDTLKEIFFRCIFADGFELPTYSQLLEEFKRQIHYIKTY